MLVWKEVIRPADYWYLDRVTGQPKKFTATPAVVKHFHDQGKAMLGAGLSIPVPLEHQTNQEGRGVTPQTQAQKAADRLLNNAGEVKDYKIKDGKLFSLLDIQDERAAQKIPKTIRYTSPYIDSFTDGNGKAWNGVITHVALTSRPRITRQEPFPTVAAALALSEGPALDSQTFAPLALSRAGLLIKDKGVLVPLYPLAFSHWVGGIALASDEIKKEIKDKKRTEGKHEGGAKPTMKEKPDPTREGARDHKEMPPHEEHSESNPGMDEMGEMGEALVDADGDIDVCDVICDLLEAVGIQMPEGTTKDNFHEHLYKAAMDHVKNKTKGPEAQMDQTNQPSYGDRNNLPANPVIQEQPPMFMALSLEQVEKITDPGMKQIARVALSLQENALASAQQKRQDRINALCKRVRHDPKFREKLEAQAKTCALSLTKGGTVDDPMMQLLDILESGIQDMPSLLGTEPGDRVEVPHPVDHTEREMTEDRRKAVVAELEKNAGLQTYAKA
jgi:hypothetical protein